jgi:hypothetical protein
MGLVKNFGDLLFNTHSLTNILSMAEEVRKVYRITMDTSMEPAMSVHRRDGSLMIFKERKSGLYYFDTTAPSHPNFTSFDVNDLHLLSQIQGHHESTQWIYSRICLASLPIQRV